MGALLLSGNKGESASSVLRQDHGRVSLSGQTKGGDSLVVGLRYGQGVGEIDVKNLTVEGRASARVKRFVDRIVMQHARVDKLCE